MFFKKITITNYILVFAAANIFFMSCTEQVHDTEMMPIEILQYALDSETTIEVALDPSLNQAHRVFSSIEEHDEYVESVENTGRVTINKHLYEELGHYYSPLEILVLDMNGELTVGDEDYRATRLATYEKPTTGNEWKMSVYHGESGTVDLEETELIHKNIDNLNALKDYKFQSPWAKELYTEKLSSISTSGRVMGKDSKYFYHTDSNNNWEIMYYRNSQTGDIFNAKIRWYCWNESYTTKWGKRRSKGGTITQVLRSNYNTWTSLNESEPLGQYHANGDRDNSLPYTKVRVRSRSGSSKEAEKYEWSVSVSDIKRPANKGTESWHWAQIRDNNSNQASYRIANVRVD